MLLKEISIFLIISAVVHSEADDYTYQEYSEIAETIEDKGSRLVNAAESSMNEFPFMGAYYWMKKNDLKSDVKCTVSLLSPTFAITAAHCFFEPNDVMAKDCEGKIFPAKKARSDARADADARTDAKAEAARTTNISCKSYPSGDLKIWLEDDSDLWYVLFGAVTATRQNGYHTEGKIHDIDYFIRHKDSYGMPDNDMGGYDIGLLKLKEAYTAGIPICLPGPNFQDTLITSRLAGYGKYYRKKCQTGTKGPMKNHYCLTSKKCWDALDFNCEPEFTLGHQIIPMKGCQKQSTPAQYSRLCERATLKGGVQHRSGDDEIHLFYFPVDKGGKDGVFLETCYRKDSDEFGWCRTEGNLYKSFLGSEKTERISSDFGWGFCSNECTQQLVESNTGVLRNIDDADVLSEKFCDSLLKESEEVYGTKYSIKPEVLCIGRMNKLKYQAFYTHDDPYGNTTQWGKLDDEFFAANPQVIKDIYKRTQIDVDSKGYYVSSVGSCQGDSGGPVFQNLEVTNKTFILTGITNGGVGRGEFNSIEE
ncbi:uncharacterized protein LOC111696136 isoform X2 [Eurytemora carolleeae]|uniref:uncharacterized protein LOC111696136 isoform X2 n=1 Tax=Eurytemora carolleeae TaxID=1294199 RepID=UPI000C758A23|nr:uncharacterized protein LOC111696136 isoform X2 [Eurytemora carolleeae]|eukprot:XP_023321459.1 uncharacterized protein LOC111696136 isoform X2 [Eurytemora affinis]